MEVTEVEEHTHDKGHAGGCQQGGQWDDGKEEELLKQLRDELMQNHRRPSIFACPFSISSNSKKKFHYLPEFVAVGPYYYDHECLISSQPQKDAAMYLTENDFLSMVKLFQNCDEEIRSYYDIPMEDCSKEKLARMMATDACFVSEWLHCLVSTGERQKPKQNSSSTSTSVTLQFDNATVSKIVKDIIKLPCQIPLPLVKEAFRRAFQPQLKGQKQCSEQFDRMVNAFCDLVLPLKRKNELHEVPSGQHLLEKLQEYGRGKAKPDESTYGPRRAMIQHLLHPIKLCHEWCAEESTLPISLSTPFISEVSGEISASAMPSLAGACTKVSIPEYRKASGSLMYKPAHQFLGLTQKSDLLMSVEDEDHLKGPMRAIGPRDLHIGMPKPEEEEKQIKGGEIPSAAELSKAGIRFTECYCGIESINYNSYSNSIELPRLVVNEFSETVLHNLIAYEHHLLENTDKYVTGFCHLMGQLLLGKKDVTVLTSAGLLDNKLGDDHKAWSIWKSMTRSVDVPSLKSIDSMKEKAWKAYEDRKVVRWWSEYRNKYCSNPWVAASAIAAVLLLIMTFLQTFTLFCPSCLVVRK